MIFLSILLFVFSIIGLGLLIYGLKKEGKISAIFGTVFLIAPIIYLTIGVEFVALTPIISLLVIYYFFGTNTNTHEALNLKSEN